MKAKRLHGVVVLFLSTMLMASCGDRSDVVVSSRATAPVASSPVVVPDGERLNRAVSSSDLFAIEDGRTPVGDLDTTGWVDVEGLFGVPGERPELHPVYSSPKSDSVVGYWISGAGWVDIDVATIPGFDPERYVAEYRAKAGIDNAM